MIILSFYVGNPKTSTLTNEFKLQNYNLPQILNGKRKKKWGCLINEDCYKQITKTSYNHILKKSNEMQQYADIYLLLNYSTFFGRPSRPLSEVHKTVVVTSGTDRTIWGASFIKRDQVGLVWDRMVASRWISST